MILSRSRSEQPGGCRTVGDGLHYPDPIQIRRTATVTKPGKARADADGGWKDIIEDFTEEFFEFYFPEVHAAIDFTEPVRFLDKELREIVTESEVAGREADKLIEVRLKDGGAEWILVHVEVQGYPDPGFSERMFIYHYRVYDRYRRDIVSLAVLTDADPGFRPTRFRRSLLGCEVTFAFPAVKVIDYDTDRLDASDSPFALVTRIHLEYLAAGSSGQKRLDARVALTRRLYQHGFSREQVIRLYRFLGYLMRLPGDLALKYREALESIEGELSMPYITDTEQLARSEGQLRGLREAVLDALEARFGEIPYPTREAVNHVGSDAALRKLLRLAVTVKSLDVFSV
jgi:hypothetical protein